MDAGINHLHRKGLGEFGQGFCVRTTDPGGCPIGAGNLNTKRLSERPSSKSEGTGLYAENFCRLSTRISSGSGTCGNSISRARTELSDLLICGTTDWTLANNAGAARAPENHQMISPVTDQSLGVSCSKGTSSTEKKDCLEQRGLPRAIPSPDQIVTGMEAQLSTLNASQIIDGKLNEAHNTPSYPASGAAVSMSVRPTIRARTRLITNLRHRHCDAHEFGRHTAQEFDDACNNHDVTFSQYFTAAYAKQ
jgi:hypothetical protein